jgi:SAM-dependent methyltransferase
MSERTARPADPAHDPQTAPDGSPVALYALLPADGEPELIHAAVPPGCAVLELGCGAGRITHPLLALGHPVVAVDQSAAMLAHVRGAETVLAAIETLDLGRRFPAVLLASQLVNTADDAQRAAFLRSCHRHLAPDGVLLVQRYDPVWAATVTEFSVTHLGVGIDFHLLGREGRRFCAKIRYTAPAGSWTHRFSARILDDAELEAELAAAGLCLRRFLDAHRTWAAAGVRIRC